MKTTLTQSQSATLIAKGISADKASERTPDWNDVNNIGKPLERRELLPIFTLADLFCMIPKVIPDEDNKPHGYHRFGIAVDHSMQWCVSYFGNCYRHIGFDNEELIDSLYQMVYWLACEKLIDLTK